MANLNKVLLMGNLTRDPELRYTPNGKAVATFTLAINRYTGGGSTAAGAERREDTCFVRIVCWEKLAELCGQYLSKGRPVFVEGRLQSRSWQAPDGSKRSTMEVVAQTVQFLGAGRAKNADPGSAADAQPDFGAADPLATHDADAPAVPYGAQPDEEVPF
ncbi:MAG: single-stranded DNA-binding protein [Candidatus Omnitrophica bacterium]|nr:single-stranded DNA-binding protein [Candidatus Omnitrophota bacterium]